MNYFGARYYDSDLGRWTSVDPLADKYPGWSPYNYTLNNPLKYIDPDGREIKVENRKDKDGNREILIKYTATIVNNSGKKLDKAYLEKLQINMKAQIEKSFSGSTIIDDKKVVWSAEADINISGEVREGDNIVSIENINDGAAGKSQLLGNVQEINYDIVKKYDEFHLGRTAAHEFGHGAGLLHKSNTLMEQAPAIFTNITFDQIERINRIFNYIGQPQD